MTEDDISHKIAAKARDLWIKKAATYRVDAQEVERTGYYSGKPMSRPAETITRLSAAADAAEAKAREWNAKAAPEAIEDDTA